MKDLELRAISTVDQGNALLKDVMKLEGAVGLVNIVTGATPDEFRHFMATLPDELVVVVQLLIGTASAQNTDFSTEEGENK